MPLIFSCGEKCLECKCDFGWKTKDGITSRGKDIEMCVGDSYFTKDGKGEYTEEDLQEVYDKYNDECDCYLK